MTAQDISCRLPLSRSDDHVFASRTLAAKLESCQSAGFTDASDHAPIIATF